MRLLHKNSIDPLNKMEEIKLDTEKYINTTPHEIIIICNEKRWSIEPSKIQLRCDTCGSKELDNLPWKNVTVPEYIMGKDFEKQINEINENSCLFVSTIVAQAINNKIYDNIKKKNIKILVPDSGPTCIRENGQIIGVTQTLQYN